VEVAKQWQDTFPTRRNKCAGSPLFSGQTPEGKRLKPHDSEIIGSDFQCIAQKSVSIMANLGGDERLLEVHKKAVSEALYRRLLKM